MTVVCHHPETVSNPDKYFTTTPQWRENGVRITPAVDTMFTAETSTDYTLTTLNIKITVDHFRNKSFKYSCYLVLADGYGEPSGTNEAGYVTVDPVGKYVLVYLCDLTIIMYVRILVIVPCVHLYIKY